MVALEAITTDFPWWMRQWRSSSVIRNQQRQAATMALAMEEEYPSARNSISSTYSIRGMEGWSLV